MKINNTGMDKSLNGIDSAKQNRPQENGGISSGNISKGTAGASTRVDLSERAQMMKKAKELAKNANVDNSEKIARLQKMIDEGSYKVDADKVADRLVDEHLRTPE